MKILLKNVRIVCPGSAGNGSQTSILIDEGKIGIPGDSNSADDADITLEADDLCVSNGWIDLKADLCDPGNEHKSTIESGLDAAALGGFTHVVSLPSTKPATDGKTAVEYQLRRAENSVTSLHPAGCITKKGEGEQLAELYDMWQTGASLFTDDLTVVSAGTLYRALLYTKDFDATVVDFPRDNSVAAGGIVNEGAASVKTGLKGDPYISEVIRVQRDIQLLAYAGGKLHLTGLSTAASVELVRQAKAEGLALTADVHAQNLVYTEDSVLDFDVNFKLMPPLRTENDRTALWNGLKDGTIDAIVSNHRPMDTEETDVEFEHAGFGNSTLQTVFSEVMSAPEAELDIVIKAFTTGPAKILQLEQHPIESGATADLTVFSPSGTWTFSEENSAITARNTPVLGKTLKGFVFGVFNNGKFILKDA